jgi:hypothetical protein
VKIRTSLAFASALLALGCDGPSLDSDAQSPRDEDAAAVPRRDGGEDAESDGGPRPDGGTFMTGGPRCLVPGGGTSEPTGPVPALEPGRWTVISATIGDLDFAGEPGDGHFGQGIAIDPCNPAVLYFSVCHFNAEIAGLYKSTDAGATWRRVGNLDEPIAVRVDPRDPEHLFAGDGVRGATLGLWESFDGGESWEQPEGWDEIAMFVDDVYEVSVDPSNFDHILVSSHSPWDWGNPSAGAGIMESVNGGRDWIAHPPEESWGYGHGIWFLENSATWLLGTQDNGYWLTENAGESWQHVVTDVHMAHGGGQVHITADHVIYVSSAQGTLRSDDGGRSFELAGDGTTFTTAIGGDGTHLYTKHAYADFEPESWRVSREDDGRTWQDDNEQRFSNGPDEIAYDSVNGILYSSTWGNGLLALRVAPR